MAVFGIVVMLWWCAIHAKRSGEREKYDEVIAPVVVLLYMQQ